MRRLIYWISLVSAGVLAIVFGAVAFLIFINFGTGKSIQAQGFEVEGDRLANCTSLVIDIETIALKDIPDLVKFAGVSEYLSISSRDGRELDGALVSRESIDEILLGRTTCLLTLEPEVTVSVVSSGSEPLDVEAFDSAVFAESGEVLKIPLQIVGGSSVVIQSDFDANSNLSFEGTILFAQAQNALLVTSLVALSLLVLVLVLIVFGVVRRKRHPILVSEES